MKPVMYAMACLVVLLSGNGVAGDQPPLTVVERVDLERYLGK